MPTEKKNEPTLAPNPDPQPWLRLCLADALRKEKSRANPEADAAMAVLLLGVPTPNGYAARRTSFNATLSFAFRFLTR